VCVCEQLHHSLQQRAQKRTGQVLNMEEISTRLAGLRGTVIAMPGLHTGSVGQVSSLYIYTSSNNLTHFCCGDAFCDATDGTVHSDCRFLCPRNCLTYLTGRINMIFIWHFFGFHYFV